MSKVWIDVFDVAGNKLGPGPITTCVSLTTVRRLDRAGEWYFTIPATDTRAAELLVPQRQVRFYSFIDSGVTEIGGGSIANITYRDQGGAPVFIVSGGDYLRELSHVNPTILSFTESFASSPPYTFIIGWSKPPEAPAAWTYTGPSTGLGINYVFRWVSVLEAMVTLVDLLGEHWRLGTSIREFEWLGSADTFADSGIRALTNIDPQAAAGNPNVCLITYIERIEDTWSLVNRIWPFGGNRIDTTDNPIDVSLATKWPDGTSVTTNPHTIDGEEYSITSTYPFKWVQSNTSITKWGGVAYSKRYDFYDIAPDADESITDADAANQLLAAAINRLTLYGDIQESYHLNVAGLDRVLLPGQTIRAQARKYVDGKRPVDIDENLIILEAQTEFSERGVQTHSLTVSTKAQWPVTQERLIAEALV